MILAAERDPGLRDSTFTASTRTSPRLCERIAATGALDAVRARALELVAAAKGGRTAPASSRAAAPLGLVADGVVQRYS